jgi:hypothetical protein
MWVIERVTACLPALDFCIVRIEETETVPNMRETKQSTDDASGASLLSEAG